MANNKIGVGLITYNSPERCKQSAFTVPEGVDKFVIVNDGTGHLYTQDCYPKHAEVINHSKNLSVGCAKNTALRALLQAGCDHIFLQEDDILIKDNKVFEAYLKAAYKSGLWHLMFGLHGPGNFNKDKQPNPRQIIDYGDNIKIAFNLHAVGAFTYYSKGIIRNVGFNEEPLKNAWEHIDHSYRIVKAGLLPAYWFWPDIANSLDYLQEIGSSEDQSVIRHTEEWIKNMQTGAAYFKHLHSYYPTQVPDIGEEKMIANLRVIAENYSRDYNKDFK